MDKRTCLIFAHFCSMKSNIQFYLLIHGTFCLKLIHHYNNQDDVNRMYC